MEVRRKSCNWGNRKETTINPVGLTSEMASMGFNRRSEWWLSWSGYSGTSKLPTALCDGVEQHVCMVVGRQEEEREGSLFCCAGKDQMMGAPCSVPPTEPSTSLFHYTSTDANILHQATLTNEF